MNCGIGSGRVTVMFEGGETYSGIATNMSASGGMSGKVRLELSMFVVNSIDEVKPKETKKEKSKMANQLSLYEYAVVLRAAEKSANKDTLLIGPKAIMAKDAKEVERLAIREVSAEVDIPMVEVFVRPFATR